MLCHHLLFRVMNGDTRGWIISVERPVNKVLLLIFIGFFSGINVAITWFKFQKGEKSKRVGGRWVMGKCRFSFALALESLV